MRKLHFLALASLFLQITLFSYAVPPEKWKEPRAWREKIEKGLSEREVFLALGKPIYTHRSSHGTTMFYQTFYKSTDAFVKGPIPMGALSLSVMEEKKPQKQQLEAEKKRSESRRVESEIRREQREQNRQGQYYDSRDVRKEERKRKLEKERRALEQKVVGWTEPNWNLVDNAEASFLFPNKDEIKPLKWQDPLKWRKLKLNIPERNLIRLFGEPTKENLVSQSSQHAEVEIKKGRPLENNERWLVYGNKETGGILKFTYDHKKSIYILAYWSEPYWPLIVKDIPPKETKAAADKEAKAEEIKDLL